MSAEDRWKPWHGQWLDIPLAIALRTFTQLTNEQREAWATWSSCPSPQLSAARRAAAAAIAAMEAWNPMDTCPLRDCDGQTVLIMTESGMVGEASMGIDYDWVWHDGDERMVEVQRFSWRARHGMGCCTAEVHEPVIGWKPFPRAVLP